MNFQKKFSFVPHFDSRLVIVSQVDHLLPDLVDVRGVALDVGEIVVRRVLQVVLDPPEARVEYQEPVGIEGEGVAQRTELGPRREPTSQKQ